VRRRPRTANPRTLDAGQLRQALAEAQQLASSHKDQYLRAVAEIENVRKRAQRDMENTSRYGLEKFAVELLPVLDSLQACGQQRRAPLTSRASPRARRQP
jgi:molecular chaperone GrpE (heat shock protein)